LRFGPRSGLRELDRREFIEHLEASCSFLWRRGLLNSEIDALRSDVYARAAARIGESTPLEPGQDIQRLAEYTGFSVAEIEEAFNAPTPKKKREFTRMIQIIQSIGRKT
jgi:hypothetical protein